MSIPLASYPPRPDGTPQILASGEAGMCPPHYWLIETREHGLALRELHRCARCGAEKETVRVDVARVPDGRTGDSPARRRGFRR